MSSTPNPSMPLVSVIMAAFRAAAHIDEALLSVRNQTHTDLEIIVVDDASPDDTAARVTKHAAEDARITLLRLPENRGQSAALNHGLARARGRFVKFFDADDIMSENALAAQLAAIEHRPRLLAYGAWGRFRHNKEETVFTPHPGWRDASSGLDWIVETWRDTEPMYQCGLFLIPKALLDETGGWDERLSLINDFEFFTRLVLAGDGVRFVPEARLYYRSNQPGSLSGIKTRRGCESSCLSALLAVRHLLARENTARTRLLAANILRANLCGLYPLHPDLLAGLEAEISRLGGATYLPQGGRLFRGVSRVAGWKTALRVRHQLALLRNVARRASLR